MIEGIDAVALIRRRRSQPHGQQSADADLFHGEAVGAVLKLVARGVGLLREAAARETASSGLDHYVEGGLRRLAHVLEAAGADHLRDPPRTRLRSQRETDFLRQ